MARETKQKVISKKHLARLERERIQRRYVILASVVVVVLALGAILVGLIDQLVLSPQQPVAVVNGEEITTRNFQAQARYYRYNIVQQYAQTYAFAQAFGDSADMQSYFTSQLQQLQAQLDPVSLGQQVIDIMIEDAIIRQKAAELGIDVSEEEIDKFIQEQFGYYPDGTPTPLPTQPTAVPPTLSPAQLELITPTPTLTPTVPATPTVVVTPTEAVTEAADEAAAQETPEATTEVEATTEAADATPTGVPTPTATATPYTEELFQQNYEMTVEDLESTANVSETQLRNIVRGQILREKVAKALFADLPYEQEQVWLRQIVAVDEAAAKLVINRVNNGDDFGKLATELSQDAATAAKGGDMGWQTRESLDPAVAEVAFDLETGEMSDPIQTDAGWVVIQSIGQQVKTLSEAEYQDLQTQKFYSWLDEQRETAEIEIFEEVWQEKVPTRPDIPAGLA